MRNLISSVSPCLCKQPKCSLPLWVFIEKPWGNTGITIPKSLGFLWVHQVHVGCSSLQWEGWQRISCDSDIAFTHSLLLLNKAKPTRFSSALGTSTTVLLAMKHLQPQPLAHVWSCSSCRFCICIFVLMEKHKALFRGYSYLSF